MSVPWFQSLHYSYKDAAAGERGLATGHTSGRFQFGICLCFGLGFGLTVESPAPSTMPDTEQVYRMRGEEKREKGRKWMRERESKLGRMGKREAEKQGCRQSGGGAEIKGKMPPEAGGPPHWRIPALPRSTSEMGSREWAGRNSCPGPGNRKQASSWGGYRVHVF